MIGPKTNQRNNPGNVKKPGTDRWKGTESYDNVGHAVFTDATYGWRALFRTLHSKYANGKGTIREIMRDYAPTTDTIGSREGAPPNDPDGYADTIAGWCGLHPDDDLELFHQLPFDPDVEPGGDYITHEGRAKMVALGCAISRFENGHQGADAEWADVLAGMKLYEDRFCK